MLEKATMPGTSAKPGNALPNICTSIGAKLHIL